jgi:hypothetical protein
METTIIASNGRPFGGAKIGFEVMTDASIDSYTSITIPTSPSN